MLTKNGFDFDKAALYRKIEPLAKSRVRRAEHIETIASYHSTHKETENIAQIGDYIITGSRHGGAYVIRK